MYYTSCLIPLICFDVLGQAGQAFIGGGRYESGAWRWLATGTPISSCHNVWAPSQDPDVAPAAGYECLVIWRDTTSSQFGQMTEYSCNSWRNYICEI